MRTNWMFFECRQARYHGGRRAANETATKATGAHPLGPLLIRVDSDTDSGQAGKKTSYSPRQP
eukprot:4873944-Pyramimonas_sp.AAC.1